MSKQVRLRRGTTLQHISFTGADGEITYDTTRKCLVVHDGATPGGLPIYGLLVLDPGAPLSLQEINSRVSITGGDLDSDAFTVEKTSHFAGPVTIDDLLYPRRINFQNESLNYAASVAINFGTFYQKSLDLTGNVTFTSVGTVNGARVELRIKSDGSLRTLTFPGAWRWIGSAAPASIAANKIGILRLICWGGDTDSDVVAQWSVEP
jgi:hypothetical protein